VGEHSCAAKGEGVSRIGRKITRAGHQPWVEPVPWEGARSRCLDGREGMSRGARRPWEAPVPMGGGAQWRSPGQPSAMDKLERGPVERGAGASRQRGSCRGWRSLCRGGQPWATASSLLELGAGPAREEQGREKLTYALESRGSGLEFSRRHGELRRGAGRGRAHEGAGRRRAPWLLALLP
jgi:hypothetical protein